MKFTRHCTLFCFQKFSIALTAFSGVALPEAMSALASSNTRPVSGPGRTTQSLLFNRGGLGLARLAKDFFWLGQNGSVPFMFSGCYLSGH